MSAVDDFLAAVEAADIEACNAWTTDCVVDATTPGGRSYLHGADAVRGEYRRWFAHPNVLDGLRRWPIPDGEIVEYTHRFENDAGPHWAHHLHVLQLRDGRIARDTVFCGGQRPLSELPEEAAAAR